MFVRIILSVILLTSVSVNSFAQNTVAGDSSLFYQKDSLIQAKPPKKNHFQTAGGVIKQFVLGSPGDFVQMKNIVKDDWRSTAIYAGGIAMLVLLDKPVTTFYQDKIEKNIDYRLPVLPGSGIGGAWNAYSNTYLNYSILGLYAGSFAANYGKGQRAALNSIKAISYSFLISHLASKAIFSRQRPDPNLSDGIAPKAPFTDNPYKFFQFRGISVQGQPDATSFPSFHATAYFSVAKVLAMEFNNYWIPYGAVTFLFFSNLDGHQHWVGDMVAGGIIGSLIGKGIVENSRKREKKLQLNNFGVRGHRKFDVDYNLMPSISSNLVGFNLLASF